MQSDPLNFNILELEAPDAFHCKILRYSAGYNELIIKSTHSGIKSQLFYIQFAFVFYFSGPVAWTGALLHQAPQDDYLQVMRDMTPWGHLTQEELLDPSRFGHLYIFETEGCRIKIVAAGVSKYASSHPMFSRDL